MLPEEIIKTACSEMRKDIIRMTYSVGNTGAHIGGSLSMVEIMAALYLGCNVIDKDNVQSYSRGRVILSKGHGVLAQYAALKQVGIITDEELMTFKKPETRLYAHPSMNVTIGIEFSSGSLGMGLSQGVGTALALKRKHKNAQTYVVLGDGECDEGSVWEAAMSASSYSLDNITAIIDENQLQYDGNTDEIMKIAPMKEKWEAFGWNAVCVNGHSVSELLDVLKMKSDKPKVIIARTIKGNGVSFMENDPKWHNGRLTKEQYEKALSEQEVQK